MCVLNGAVSDDVASVSGAIVDAIAITRVVIAIVMIVVSRPVVVVVILSMGVLNIIMLMVTVMTMMTIMTIIAFRDDIAGVSRAIVDAVAVSRVIIAIVIVVVSRPVVVVVILSTGVRYMITMMAMETVRDDIAGISGAVIDAVAIARVVVTIPRVVVAGPVVVAVVFSMTIPDMGALVEGTRARVTASEGNVGIRGNRRR
jgi:hypothetical protein